MRFTLGAGGGATRFVLFLMTSGASVVVNLLVRYLLAAAMRFELAVACAYIVSTAVAFLLARSFVFENGPEWRAELGRFLIVNAFGFLQVLAIGTLLVRWVFPQLGLTWHPEEIAHFLALSTLAVTSYQAHRLFSFRGLAK